LRDFNHFTKSSLEPAWVMGFIEGDGSFNISLKKYQTKSKPEINMIPKLEFSLNQSEKSNEHGLLSFINQSVFEGKCSINKKGFSYGGKDRLSSSSVRVLIDTIFPFFEKRKIVTHKITVNFKKVRRVALWIDKKEHLTVKGFEKIKKYVRSLVLCCFFILR
jgi:hypothetical protein